MIFQIGVVDVVLAGGHAAPDRHTGFVNSVGTAGDQRMPPVEITPLGDQAIAAARR